MVNMRLNGIEKAQCGSLNYVNILQFNFTFFLQSQAVKVLQIERIQFNRIITPLTVVRFSI